MIGQLQKTQQLLRLHFMQSKYVHCIDQQFKIISVRCHKFLHVSNVKKILYNDLHIFIHLGLDLQMMLSNSSWKVNDKDIRPHS
jgi:hypothetical protein